MLKKLGQRWGVNNRQLFLILCTFAVTGTFTAWVSRGITGWLDIDKFSVAWWLLKIGVLLIGYQLFILFFGFCFGQFSFFWKYEQKILARIGILKKKELTRIAIFASGEGSNTRNIINQLHKKEIEVGIVISNKPSAKVLDVARQSGIGTYIITREENDSGTILHILQENKTAFIVLAGYLWPLSLPVIKAYPGKILNIHPALLPQYGGKGMYGSRVHQAVINNKEKESGISIHLVDEIYDNGEVIFQDRCPVLETDTAQTLADKIHELEHLHYPSVILSLIKKQKPR